MLSMVTANPAKTYRRHGLVVVLLAFAAIGTIAARPPSYRTPFPSLPTLLAGSGWRTSRQEASGGWTAYNYQQWLVANRQDGGQASIYLGAASEVQKVAHWTGELGYQGDGYQVVRQGRTTVTLRDGSTAPVALVVVQHLADRLALAYALVAPQGISARPTDNLLAMGWDVLRGDNGPYYVARVAMSQASNDTTNHVSLRAAALLSVLLSHLHR